MTDYKARSVDAIEGWLDALADEGNERGGMAFATLLLLREQAAEIERLRGQVEVTRERTRKLSPSPNNCKCSICGDEHYDVAGPAI